MEPILFYGVPSGCSFCSIVAVEWLGKPYRLCRIEMPEIVKSESYLRINPVGETPALMTADGRVLAESMAILNHLGPDGIEKRSEEHTSELQSLMRISYAVFCLKKKTITTTYHTHDYHTQHEVILI